MRVARTTTILTGVALLTLSVTACGGNSDSTPASTDSASSAAATPSTTPKSGITTPEAADSAMKVGGPTVVYEVQKDTSVFGKENITAAMKADDPGVNGNTVIDALFDGLNHCVVIGRVSDDTQGTVASYAYVQNTTGDGYWIATATCADALTKISEGTPADKAAISKEVAVVKADLTPAGQVLSGYIGTAA